MIVSWSDLTTYVRADCRSRGAPLSLRGWLFDPVLRFQVLMRLDEYLLNTGKPLVMRAPILLWFRRLSVRLGFSMGPNIFGPGLAIVHYGAIVIDPTTRIGKNCRIHVGSHIGGAAQFVAAEDVHKFSPRIGDNVYIGPGAKLYGPIVVGDNCVIGANAVVTKSFPEAGLTLAGVPAKVIERGGNGARVIRGAG
ncbi:MAG: DapH/DapD/GlmU-related protein [Novosphingobium sp.]|nr:DapH/DapD/GlmU-related protein [Novosphingobium sp.]